MFHTKALQKFIPPVALAIVLLGFYIGTLAPGLTWANGGSDGGDLITAAVTGGIPHPTGYPLYLLLARIFQLLPMGSLAFRTNVMSALATILASMLVYWLVTQSSISLRTERNWSAGLAAGFAFGLAPLVWSQAVITEVYALQSFLILIILYLYTRKDASSPTVKKRLDRWRGLILGLAMCNHITTIFIVPLAVLMGSTHRTTEVQDNEGLPTSKPLSFDMVALRRQLSWFGIGLSGYIILPIRALSHPSVNWGNPITAGRFWWLVSGQLYQSYFLPSNLAGVWEHLQAWATILLGQLGLPGLILGLLGLVVYGRFSRLYTLTTWIALIFSVFAVLYRSIDAYLYLIPMILAFSIWIGVGITSLGQEFVGRFSNLGLVLGVLMTGYFIGHAILNHNQVDASQDLRAEIFTQEVLSTAPKESIIFAKGDQAVFALWYYHFGLQQRTDLAVIASDLLHFDWYQETLETTYPGLNLPGSFPWPETVAAANPSRPACFVEYTNQTEIECSSP
jgi:hypothetical protein